MPSLGTDFIRVKTDTGVGEPFVFKTAISVDNGGTFAFTFPEELAETAEMFIRSKPNCRFMVHKAQKNWMLKGSEKSACKHFLVELVREYLKCEVIRETVILYKTEAALSYWKTAAGEIVPNGGYDPDYNAQRGQWGGANHATRRTSTFSIGLAAQVYIKVTAKRSSGDQIGYEITHGGNHLRHDTWLQKLNSFTSVSFDQYELENMKQIPYTEEAAKFFFEAMLAMCKLSDRIEGFFDNPESLQKLIIERCGFLLGPGDSR